MKKLVLMIGMAMLPFGGAGAEESCPVFLLKRGPDGIAVDQETIAAGSVQVWSSGPRSPVIDVVLPVGPGGSGNIVSLEQENLHVVRCDGWEIHHQVKTPDGKSILSPARSLEDLRGQDIRLSVIGGDGSRRAFLIPGYRSVEHDPGPVQDLFAGKSIPLGPDDYNLTTDTYLRRPGPAVSGRASLELDGHPFVRVEGPDGTAGWFVIDIGAGTTVVDPGFLPEGIEIQESEMVRYSAAGREVLKYRPSGATGPVEKVLGNVRLSSLEIGAIRFADPTVQVMEMPDLFDRPVAGILGLDLLRRADRLILEFPAGAAGPGTLRLASGSDRAPSEEGTELPFSIVRSHMMIRGACNGTRVDFILDTGAPAPLLDPPAARAAGVEFSREDARPAGGVDGGRVESFSGSVGRLQVGTTVLETVPVRIAPLAVFDSLQTGDQRVGLLGNTFFGSFQRVEFDFPRYRVRFVP